MKIFKYIGIFIGSSLACFASAQTIGDEEALNYIEDARDYSEIAVGSYGGQRKLYVRKAAAAANMACRLADTPRYKEQFCSVADQYGRVVTFD